MTFVPTDPQRLIIESDDSALVLSGPGRGKTATALASAARVLERTESGDVLFTSFSNAAVRRLLESSQIHLPANRKGRLKFRTFHGLAFDILRDYGRFVGLKSPASVMDEPERLLATLRFGWATEDEGGQESALRAHARATGKLAFSEMIPLATILLRSSDLLRRAAAGRYPLVVVDEYQDTRPEQWELLKVIALHSRVIALGDPNQMIYTRQFEQALARLDEFESWKGIKRSDLGSANFRCGVPNIVAFAEAILTGKFGDYRAGGSGVALKAVYPNQWRAHVASTWKRIVEKHPDATIAIIVPTRAKTRSFAADLRNPPPGAAVPIPIRAHLERDEAAADAYRLAVLAAFDYTGSQTAERRAVFANALAVAATMWTRKRDRAAVADKLLQALVPGSRRASRLRELLREQSSFDGFPERFFEALGHENDFGSMSKALRLVGVPVVGKPDGSGFAYEAYMEQRKAIGMEGDGAVKARTSILSMHQAKGREFDFVIMLVEPRDHPQEMSVSEIRRLYYVAATRARKWLGVVYPPFRPGPVLKPLVD